MTTVRAELVGDKAIVHQADLARLVELARRSEPVDLQMTDPDVSTRGIMELAEQGGAFAWLDEEDDLYTVDDLKVRYR